MIEVNSNGDVVVVIKGDIETYHNTFRALVAAIMLVDTSNCPPGEYYQDLASLIDDMTPSLEQLKNGLKPK